MKHWSKKTLVASLLAVPLMTSVAFADTAATTSDAFTAKYQQNLTLENQLLAEAQKSTVSNSEITQLKQAIQNINQQVATLYQARQDLVSERSVLRQISEAHLAPIEKQLAELNKQRAKLRKESQDEWKLVNKYLHKKHHNRRDEQNLKKALGLYKATDKRVAEVNAKIAKLKEEENKWLNAPYDGGVAALDDAILKLQLSAIHYTKELIALEDAQTSDTTSSGVDASTSTLSASSTTATVNSPITYTLVLKDASGKPITGKASAITPKSQSTTVSFSSVTESTTNPGTYTFTATDTTPENLTVSVSVANASGSNPVEITANPVTVSANNAN